MKPITYSAIRIKVSPSTNIRAGIKWDPSIEVFLAYSVMFDIWAQGKTEESAIANLKQALMFEIESWNPTENNRIFSENPNCEIDGLWLRLMENEDNSICRCSMPVIDEDEAFGLFDIKFDKLIDFPLSETGREDLLTGIEGQELMLCRRILS